ncbi:MAG: (2Fe-2S)-binding protein [Alkaliphilus sp.]|nr:(2Fe-2S)-binding protein [bacterium AH-315-L21]MBN4069349.1 (2Fe-2S)-binding protein [bacterium AH-315-G05]PHS35995.1 MAG: (2Fe-2S)-binding protein [Alkaliphilus sp.]
MMAIQITINDVNYDVEISEGDRLLDVLRDKFHLTGTKEGCGEGECGACTVIMDDVAVNSCMILAFQANRAKIYTIESMKENNVLHPIQQAFLDEGAVQCGFCIPGMIMSAKAFLDKNDEPTRKEIREAISGNLCRCTGYNKMVNAIDKAAKFLKEGEKP